MRGLLPLWLAACSVGAPVAADPWDAARVLPTRDDLVPESDAVLPPWFEGALPLAHGATLTQGAPGNPRELILHDSAGERSLGELLGRPSADASRERIVFPRGDAGGGAIMLLAWDGGAWKATELLASEDPPDRAAIDPTGQRVAFVWAGPRGGVAGVWVMGVEPGSAPVRLTNGGAFTPGRPPEGFIPLPVGLAPRWDGDTLRWRSEVGEHVIGVK